MKLLQEMYEGVELLLSQVAKTREAEHRANRTIQQLAERLKVSENARLEAETKAAEASAQGNAESLAAKEAGLAREVEAHEAVRLAIEGAPAEKEEEEREAMRVRGFGFNLAAKAERARAANAAGEIPEDRAAAPTAAHIGAQAPGVHGPERRRRDAPRTAGQRGRGEPQAGAGKGCL